MSKKKLFSLISLLFFLCASITAQLTEKHKSTLSKELLLLINELRADNGFDTLEIDAKIKKPAETHSQYMAKNKDLSHEQSIEELKTPFKRFYYFDCKEYGLVGENVLRISFNTSNLTVEYLKSIAQKMYISWKNSPGHYANMIHEYYEQTNFGFEYSSEEKIIYATNVFGKKGIRIDGQLTENSFNIKPERDCDKELGYFNNILANLGNKANIEGDSVVLSYYSKKYFNKFLPDNKSGLAIDLISRSQFDCAEKNQLDISPIYDGIMLKPVYKNEIIKNNRAESEYRIISNLGAIPEDLKNENITASLILIQNETRCKYLIPGSVQRKAYQLRTIKPKLLNPQNANLRAKGLIKSQLIEYEFETNKTDIFNASEIEKNINSIHSIEIHSFSSVEGSTEKNKILHDKRAETIKNHLNKSISITAQNITINSKENWDEMEFQLKYYFQDQLLLVSKDSLKEVIKLKSVDIPWDSLLHEQRRSIARIVYFSNTIDTSNTEEYLKLNLKTAIINKDYDPC
jgi:uncharacterized protein YkwD